MKLLHTTIASIGSMDADAIAGADERLASLLKPPGSLGRLEEIARQLAGITGKVKSRVDKKAILVMCGDNGITEEGISSFPSDVSFLVADTMLKGIAGVAVLARHAGADLKVTDLGLFKDVTAPGMIQKKIRRGTSNFLKGPAMTRDEAVKAVETGIETAQAAADEGYTLLGTGEVGIGNTTTSSAVLHALTGGNLDILTGRGAGLTDEALEHKKKVIRMGVEMNSPDPGDPLDVLAKVGGFDIAGLTGCFLGAASRRVPIVIDGFISGTAAVLAHRLCPASREFMFTSHVSVEPGTRIISELLGLHPMLFMNMRLGEGTGCALAFNIIEAATKIMSDMGTFADIGM